jgi:hypothetical protein
MVNDNINDIKIALAEPFICGQTCNCVDDCDGNPDPKLKEKFKKVVNSVRNIDRSYLKKIEEDLGKVTEWTVNSIRMTIGPLDQQKGNSIRIALTGKPHHGVPLSECMVILGRDEVLRRISSPTSLLI